MLDQQRSRQNQSPYELNSGAVLEAGIVQQRLSVMLRTTNKRLFVTTLGFIVQTIGAPL